jgi:hypothetical protein
MSSQLHIIYQCVILGLYFANVIGLQVDLLYKMYHKSGTIANMAVLTQLLQN